MSAIAAAIAGAAVVGAGAAVYSSNKAAGAQKDAAASANQTQSQMFNTISGNEQPYNAQGQQASAALGQFYGLPGANGQAQTPDYSKILSSLPGYQFQLQQGSQAVDRSQAAKGLLNSGATGKALEQYGQGLAQNYAGQYTQGLQNLAQMGQAAASNQASAGMNAANQMGGNAIYAGNAAAAGYANMGNAIGGAVNQGVGLYGMYQNYTGGGGYNYPNYGGNAYASGDPNVGGNGYIDPSLGNPFGP